VSAILFHSPAATQIYTLSLHDALPILGHGLAQRNRVKVTSIDAVDGVGERRAGREGVVAMRVGGRLVDFAEGAARRTREQHDGRSEEHTSELQSLRHLVCRLLLEKKNR